jgi:hypothetical protein
MASVDLKDAHYSVPVSPASCPRKFTKLLKPAYTILRRKGHVSSGYIDDAYLQGNTNHDCACNVVDTVDLFSTLGLVVHPDKSVFEPTQTLEFLGFLLNSILMRITLTTSKVDKIIVTCTTLVNKRNKVSIREV